MSDQPNDRLEAGSIDMPDVLRTLAGVLPQFQGEALESQLQTFDVFLGILAPSVRPQVAALLAEAAAKSRAKRVRERIQAAADAVAQGGRAAEPYNHAQAMQEYQQTFVQDHPHAFDPIEDAPESELPEFKYHPDPMATGSIIASDTECECCGQARGFIYTGPVYAEEEYEDCICPWCIADGSAHEKLDASFTDEAGIGGGSKGWCEVAQEIIEEVAYRTPGFCGWQQERWWTHCDDAAQFLGAAGKTELLSYGDQAIDAIRADAGVDDEQDWENFFNTLDKDGSPTAYLFRCRKCGALGGYQDCD